MYKPTYQSQRIEPDGESSGDLWYQISALLCDSIVNRKPMLRKEKWPRRNPTDKSTSVQEGPSFCPGLTLMSSLTEFKRESNHSFHLKPINTCIEIPTVFMRKALHSPQTPCVRFSNFLSLLFVSNSCPLCEKANHKLRIFEVKAFDVSWFSTFVTLVRQIQTSAWWKVHRKM